MEEEKKKEEKISTRRDEITINSHRRKQPLYEMMAQFHPSASATTFLDSFQFSLAARLHFSTYASSIRITHKRFRYSINSQRSADERGRSVVSVSNPRCELSSKWIGKWDEANRNYRPKQPPTVLNYRAAGNVSCSAAAGGGGRTMDRIVEKLKRFGYMDGGVDGGKETTAVQRVVEKASVEDIFYVEDGMLPTRQISRGLLFEILS